MTAAYPQVQDWDDYRLARWTTILGDGSGASLALGLTDSLDVLDQSLADLAQQVGDPTSARLPVLRQLAGRYGVRVDGLGLSEARLIVAGAAVASRSSGSTLDVCEVWLAATGATADRAAMSILPRGCLTLSARVETPPNPAYLVALRAVMQRAMPAGYGLHAWIGVPGTGDYDETRYDGSTYGWSIAITRPGD